MAEGSFYMCSIEHSKPTIFEIWAEESFMAALQPACQLLWQFGSASVNSVSLNEDEASLSTIQKLFYKPLKLAIEWSDETFMVFNLILQSTYLNQLSASFSESFYGLRRVSVVSPSDKLTIRAKVISLIGLVGAPYVMMKLKNLVDNRLFNSTSGQISGNDLKLLECYRVLNSFIRIIKVYYYVTYMSGYSNHYSIFHKLAGLQLVHQNQPSLSWFFKITSLLFELGAFSLQFINWWNSSESQSMKVRRNIVLPKPSLVEPLGVCPICNKEWKVEVVLSTSGIVYCYSCITRILSETGRCPVTKLPFNMNDLIRLYPSV